MLIDSGGPFFPEHGSPGITRRDYIAALVAAQLGIVIDEQLAGATNAAAAEQAALRVARAAYILADALILASHAD